MHAPAQTVSDEDRRWIVIGALVSMMLAALDQTIVAPALPTIGASLGSPDWLSWVVSAYFLTATAVTPLYGKLADIKGRRPVMIAGVAIFLVGSVLCALAPSMGVLIVARALQGIGGGGLIALAQTIIGDIVPPYERARYMVYISGTWAIASIAGPVLGGVFAEHLHWSLIFWINLPIGAMALSITSPILKRLPLVHRPHKLDILGAVLMVVATVSLMLALTWGGTRYAWASREIIGLGAAAVVLFAVFGFHVVRAEEALVPPRVLGNKVIAAAATSLFFTSAVYVGLAVYVPIFLEQVYDMPPSLSGTALVALLAGTVAGANIAGRFTPRVKHYKHIALGGSAVAIAAMTTFALGAPYLPFWAFEILLVIAGLGQGTQWPIGTVSVQNAADPHDLGTATAAMGFLRSLGSVIGIAVLGAIVLANGIVQGLEGAGHGPVATAAGVERAKAAAAFVHVFGAAAIIQCFAFVSMALMKELPLRGRVAKEAVAATVE